MDKDLKKQFGIEDDMVFKSQTCTYIFNKILGRGAFGIAAQCTVKESGQDVVIKVGRKEALSVTEAKALREIKKYGSENYNIVKFYESFSYMEKEFLVFEQLEMTLKTYMEKSRHGRLDLCKIRVIGGQVLVALNFLHKVRMVHRDIKPDNIMLVNNESLKVKLIDFSFLSTPEKANRLYCCPKSYRPPEEILNLPLELTVDMWLLGVTFVFLYLKRRIFRGESESEVWGKITSLLGEPEPSVLIDGHHTFLYYSCFFEKGEVIWVPKKMPFNIEHLDNKSKSLEDVLTSLPVKDDIERTDLKFFIDLVKQMLTISPKKRITSSDALSHPFISMSHLSVNDINCPYVQRATDMMRNYKFQAVGNLGFSSSELSLPDPNKTTNLEKSSLNSSERITNRPPETSIHERHLVDCECLKCRNSPTELPLPVSNDHDGHKTARCDDSSYPVEVKTNKKHFNRIRNFFSKCFCPGTPATK